MAGSSLLILLDDIATVLDDVATMTKVAAHKTAGVLGDDLAVNAEKVTGVRAERELPVVWAVARGSLRNKCLLVPAAMGIAFVAPQLITPLLMLGGLYLSYEGFEKLVHDYLHKAEDDAHHAAHMELLEEHMDDLVAFEKARIRGAIRTDFILSAEIIVLTLGIVAAMDFYVQLLVLCAIALTMTLGVYGLVAAIVKLDDAGAYLLQKQGPGRWTAAQRWAGLRLLNFAPRLMKLLGVVGMIAMFLVGGGILVHGLDTLEHTLAVVAEQAAQLPAVGALLATLTPSLGGGLVGVVAGGLTLLVIFTLQRLRAACNTVT